MTNFDRFHREAMGLRGLSISRLRKTTLCPFFFSAGGVNSLADVLLFINTYSARQDQLKHPREFTRFQLGLENTCGSGFIERKVIFEYFLWVSRLFCFKRVHFRRTLQVLVR